MIKAIIFDCFGVLTTDLWKEFVASLPLEQQEQASILNKQVDGGVISINEFFRQVEGLTGRPAPEIEHTISNSQDKNFQLLEYAEKLRKDYKLAILSNIASDFITDSFLSSQEQEIFDVIVASHAIGFVKPSKQIYDYTATKLGLQTHECVMIDDSLSNCDGARKAGMKAVHYINYHDLRKDMDSLLTEKS